MCECVCVKVGWGVGEKVGDKYLRKISMPPQAWWMPLAPVNDTHTPYTAFSGPFQLSGDQDQGLPLGFWGFPPQQTNSVHITYFRI